LGTPQVWCYCRQSPFYLTPGLEKKRKENKRKEKKRKEKKRKEKKRKEKKRKEKKRKEKKRKDYTFRRQFNEKPCIIPGCPASLSYIGQLGVFDNCFCLSMLL